MIHSRFRCVSTLVACGAFAWLASCAEVSIRKVPSPAEYVVNGMSTWTREDQAAADAMEGMRFYLPRPYLVVFESFPVATDLYLARGRIGPDGKFVSIDAVMPITTRGDLLEPSAVALPSSISIPNEWIFRPGAKLTDAQAAALADAAAAIKPQSGDDVDALKQMVADAKAAAGQATAAAAAAREQAGGAAGGAGGGGAGGAATGINQQAVENSNGAFAYQPLRGSFDLAYLPDFDEQYVVNSKANLGNAQFKMNLGQGWSLQGFNATVDNSELNKRIFSLLDTAIAAAKAAAGAAFPPAGIATAASNLLARPQAGDELPRTSTGTPVTLKLVVVQYAAKGLYPVIKPRELYNRVAPGVVIDLADASGVQNWALSGAARQPSEAVVRAAVDQLDRQARRSTVPIYPYQYVSFNTFRYLSIEAVTVGGNPFGTLYDRTGTTGDPGDRQAYDASEVITKLLGAMASGAGGGGAGESVTATTIDLAKVKAALEPLAGPNGAARQAVAKVLEPGPAADLVLAKAGAATERKVNAQVKVDDIPAATALRPSIQAALLKALGDDATLTSALGGRVQEVTVQIVQR